MSRLSDSALHPGRRTRRIHPMRAWRHVSIATKKSFAQSTDDWGESGDGDASLGQCLHGSGIFCNWQCNSMVSARATNNVAPLVPSSFLAMLFARMHESQ